MNTTHRQPITSSATTRKLRITRVTPRPIGGAWVHGTIAGFAFEALVFPEHAEFRDYEIEQSRISKLCLRRQPDRTIVYAWDRGLDTPCIDPQARRAVTVLCARLAPMTFGNAAKNHAS